MLILSALIAVVVLLFGGILFWALVMQPKTERTTAELTVGDAWKASKLEQFAAKNFSLYQIIPTPNMTQAEYRIQDDSGRELGRYTGTGRRSGTLEYGDKQANLYIQGAPFGGSVYAGKVGGRSNRSIVIRDETHVIAEVWREKIFPAKRYRFVHAGETFYVAGGGLSLTLPGGISRNGEQIGAFRRPSGSSRNLFLAVRKDLSDELKVCFGTIILLQ